MSIGGADPLGAGPVFNSSDRLHRMTVMRQQRSS